MKILIVNTNDIKGGAARAAYRLHQVLLAQNIDSQMLVHNKDSNDKTVITHHNTLAHIFNKPIDGLLVKKYKQRQKELFSPVHFTINNIINKINKINPDIVHLHWVCRGMLTIEQLANIKAPIIWSMHDNWLFTGGCHVMWGCKKYEDNCGNCPKLNSNTNIDLSYQVFQRKQQVFSQLNNLTIVGLSQWLSNCAKNSALLKDKKHINLPNPIDTNIFKPTNKIQAREFWKLPKNKKLVLFGAMGVNDKNKGFEMLKEALNGVTSDIELVIFGGNKTQTHNFKFKTHILGRIQSDENLALLYSAVDIAVVPSMQENLSNVIMENLACTTPVVAFDIGGNSDMVVHKKAGYLAKPFDENDLKNGIEWVLDNADYHQLCENARNKVLDEFDSEVVAKKYIKLYKACLNPTPF